MDGANIEKSRSENETYHLDIRKIKIIKKFSGGKIIWKSTYSSTIKNWYGCQSFDLGNDASKVVGYFS